MLDAPDPSDDYADAHDRHWKDAERLFGCAAWANADHLYGLSAECGLKAVFQIAGQPIDAARRKHVDELWPAFVLFAEGRWADWLALLPTGAPFSDWSIDQRYAHRRNFDKPLVAPHRNAARAVGAMLQFALRGGKR